MRYKFLLNAVIVGPALLTALFGMMEAGATRLADASTTLFVNTTNDELNADGDCSLREAISAANSDSSVDGCSAGNGHDTIVLSSGTYTLTLDGAGDDLNVSGDLDITDSVTLIGVGPDQTFIDAGGLSGDRVIDLQWRTPTVVISGVTVMGGQVTGNGGGIFDFAESFTLVNSNVISNSASESGGGIYLLGNKPFTHTKGVIGYNRANDGFYGGGGIFISVGAGPPAEIWLADVISNTARNGGGILVRGGIGANIRAGRIISNVAERYGGGIKAEGNVTLSGGLIMHNRAIWGGGAASTCSCASFNLTGGQIISNSASNNGGGLYAGYGPSTITGGSIVSNTAYSGAGVYVAELGTLTMTGGLIAGNHHPRGNGGGISVDNAEALLLGGRIYNNRTNNGGGIHVNVAHVTLDGIQVVSNTARVVGGGIYIYQAGSVVTQTGNTVFSQNRAGFDGGGVYNYAGTAILNQGQISENRAGRNGGGIFNNSELELVNLTISGNRAEGGDGGGLFNNAGNVVLTYTTVASNTALSSGGGISNSAGVVTLKNSILSYNAPDNCGPAAVGSAGYNLEFGVSCGFSMASDLSNADPMLGPLSQNGGNTLNHALRSGGPAIDSADCLTNIALDQRGVVRPLGAGCDIGAFEFGELTVKKTGPAEADAVELITYTLVVTNGTGLNLVDVVVVDVIPTGAHYVSGGTQAENIVRWVVGSLSDGESVTQQFAVNATTTITNSDYGVTAANGISANGEEAVVTVVDSEWRLYLPLILNGPPGV